MKLHFEHASYPKGGERVNGDAVFIREEGGRVLFGVIDALGHGPHAAAVAELAVDSLRTVRLDLNIIGIMQKLHTALDGSRGAAATLCLFQDPKLYGCGVGNVEVRCQPAKLPVTLTPGILGSRVHRLRGFEGETAPGMRLIIFSDGLSSKVSVSDTQSLSAERACRVLMDRHRRLHDDATVLIADVEE